MLAAEARAVIDLPPFDRTAMDGYAVRAADVAPGARAARARRPGRGRRRGITLEPGTAARISTGAAIPPGADAVLRVEDTELDGDTVTATAGVAAGLHIRRRAEDVHAGDVLASPATC